MSPISTVTLARAAASKGTQPVEVLVVSKCANPGCSSPFHYLRDGKVFRIQMEGRPAPGPQLLHPAKPAAHVEHFWLCGACSSTMTLLVDNGKVVAVPLSHIQYRRAAAS